LSTAWKGNDITSSDDLNAKRSGKKGKFLSHSLTREFEIWSKVSLQVSQESK
jgi:hypothetical protein